MTTITDYQLIIAEDGTLKLPKEVLEALGTREVRLELDEGRMVIQLRPKMLHEIENPEERVKAFKAFIREFAVADGPKWPENYNVRDDIYD